MVSARHVFRFTIGQGMAVIAAFAVAFAFLPMPVAIVLSLVTLLQVLRTRLVHRRLAIADPARGERIGCLSCYLGLLVGATLGVVVVTRYSNTAAVGGHSAVITAAVGCGLLGAIVGGVIGHLVALSLPRQTFPHPDASEAKRAAILAEIDSLERMLAHARVERDEDVATKLTAYKARLRRELENRAGDLSDPPGDITVDLPSPVKSGEQFQ